MTKYTEYDFDYECDFDNIKVTRHLEKIGEITINEDHVESEKEVLIDDDNVRYRLRKVTMVSGAVHYLLVDKHEYTEEDNPEKFVLAIYNNGKNRGYVQCIDTKYNDGISFVKVFEKKHATVFTLYPETDTDEAGIAWGSMTNDDAMCYSDFIDRFEPFTIVKELV
jgi:hypothetical protein